jgi:hypothetical protein
VSAGRDRAGSRSLILAAVGAVVLLLLAMAAFAWYSMRDVEDRTGEIIVATDGRVIKDSTRTIRVPASEAGKYSVTKRTVDADKEFARLFAAAQAAMARHDLTAAQAALTQALTYKPQDPTATAQLSDIRAGRKPKPTGPGAGGTVSKPPTGSTSTTPRPVPPRSDAPVPVPSPQLAAWVPDKLDGFTTSPSQIDELTVSRQYVPVSRGRAGGLVIVVQQFASSGAAQSALVQGVATDYPQEASVVSINGRPAYFGTDGRRFAVLAINANGTLVALEMDSTAGGPAGLRQDLQSVAAKLGR